MHRIALFVFVVALLSLPTITGAQLQPGSTGGTIGKTDKSISGGEERQETGARPERTNSSTSRGEHTTSESSIAGRWRWDARCGQGNFQGEFEIGEGKQFTGAFLSDLPGPISNGRRNGNQVSFSRQSLGQWQPWTGSLRGSNSMAGSLVRTDAGGDRCTWTATRQ